ncbi:MAG: hypothetical protein GF341_04170, partial [candidate division Zixibacteria bacterium]|nr:hypothetical protein [candidate division Zixibacteria bacterium]
MPDSWVADSVTLVTERSHFTGRGNANKWYVEAKPVNFADIAVVVDGLPDAELEFDGEITPPRDGLWYFAGTTTG